MDDLQLAVETVLLNRVTTDAAVTLEASIDDSMLAIWIGPLDRTALARARGGIDVDRLLSTLVDHAEVEDRITEAWLRIEKRIPTRKR